MVTRKFISPVTKPFNEVLLTSQSKNVIQYSDNLHIQRTLWCIVSCSNYYSRYSYKYYLSQGITNKYHDYCLEIQIKCFESLKDPLKSDLPNESPQLFKWIQIHQIILSLYQEFTSPSIIYQATRELNNSKNLQFMKDKSDPNSIKSFVINYSITRECYNIPSTASTASTILRVQNIMLININ